MLTPKNILIAGSSGMVGKHLLQICLDSNEVRQIILLSRKSTTYKHSKIQEIIVDDFLNYDSIAPLLNHIDIVYFCIGVYTGNVERDLFKKITVDYPVALAKIVLANSATSKFILLSGAGADRTEKSKMMFAKDKGMVENKLYQLFNNNFHSARPGYIYPITKRQEPNFMYTISRIIYPVIKLFGKKYSITSLELAKALFVLGMQSHQQTSFENEELIALTTTI